MLHMLFLIPLLHLTTNLETPTKCIFRQQSGSQVRDCQPYSRSDGVDVAGIHNTLLANSQGMGTQHFFASTNPDDPRTIPSVNFFPIAIESSTLNLAISASMVSFQTINN